MKALVTGGDGQLGTAFRHIPPPRDIQLIVPAEDEFDVTDADMIESALASSGADILINAAAYTAVDRAESEENQAFLINRDAPALLSAACNSHGVVLIHVSTDFVFNGKKETPYTEDDPIAPINVYGASKAAGEAAVRQTCPRHIIVRTSWIYSPWGNNFIKTILRASHEKATLEVVGDQLGAPTSATDLAETIVGICTGVSAHEFSAWGTYHYTGDGYTSWFGLAQRIVDFQRRLTKKGPDLREITSAEYPRPAQRPANSRLDCSKIKTVFEIAPKSWEVSVDVALEQLSEFAMRGQE